MSGQPTAPPASYSYEQPPPKYESLPQQPAPHVNYGSTTNYQYPRQYPPQTQPPQNSTAQVIIVGGCPACRVGVLDDDYTALGVLCAVLFFPLGILCCLALKQRRCSNCGAIFG